MVNTLFHIWCSQESMENSNKSMLICTNFQHRVSRLLWEWPTLSQLKDGAPRADACALPGNHRNIRRCHFLARGNPHLEKLLFYNPFTHLGISPPLCISTNILLVQRSGTEKLDVDQRFCFSGPSFFITSLAVSNGSSFPPLSSVCLDVLFQINLSFFQIKSNFHLSKRPFRFTSVTSTFWLLLSLMPLHLVWMITLNWPCCSLSNCAGFLRHSPELSSSRTNCRGAELWSQLFWEGNECMLNIYYLPDRHVISTILHDKPDIIFDLSTNKKINFKGV